MRRFEVRKHQNSSPKTNESAVAVLNKSKQKYKHLNDVIAKPSKQDPETRKRESNLATSWRCWRGSADAWWRKPWRRWLRSCRRIWWSRSLLGLGLATPLQLRCVCKQWKSLVLDLQFMKKNFHTSFLDIKDLTSKAMEDMNVFQLQLNTPLHWQKKRRRSAFDGERVGSVG